MDAGGFASDGAYLAGAEGQVGWGFQEGDGAFGGSEDKAGDLCGQGVYGAHVIDMGMGEEDAADGEVGGGGEDVLFGVLEVGIDEGVAGIVFIADEEEVDETEASELEAVAAYAGYVDRHSRGKDTCCIECLQAMVFAESALTGLTVPRLLRSGFLLLVCTSFASVGWAQASANLAPQGWYADPEIRVFGGEYWIYPTSSDPAARAGEHRTFNALQSNLRAGAVIHPVYLLHTSLDAFSSTDLVHWTKHEDVLDVKNVGWAAYAIWAPTAIHLNGKYYLFFAANDIQKNDKGPGGIGEAVSDQPGGPFIDALGKPLIGEFHNGAQPIDPMVFRDDDGSIYFYYGGQGHCNVARLSEDLKTVIPMKDGSMYREITPEHYVEGPFVIKRKGVYYFMWSEGSWENATYGVAYAKSDSPTGPFVRAGKILGTDAGVANGPGHHSVVQIPGTDEWYIVYHRHPLGTTGANERVMAIDAMHFDAQGDIDPVVMTKDGVGARLLTGSGAGR